MRGCLGIMSEKESTLHNEVNSAEQDWLTLGISEFRAWGELFTCSILILV